MARATEIDAIVHHALENERNLRMAVKVGLAYQSLKDEIVHRFVVALKTAVQKDLGSRWVVGTCLDPADELEKGDFLNVRRRSWGDCSVGLGGEKTGAYLFVYVGSTAYTKTRQGKKLKQSLDHELGHGRVGSINPWWMYLDRPLRDWATEEALLALYRHKDAVSQLSPRLERLARLSAPFLNKL